MENVEIDFSGDNDYYGNCYCFCFCMDSRKAVLMSNGLAKVTSAWAWVRVLHSYISLHKGVHAAPKSFSIPSFSTSAFERILLSFKEKAVCQGFNLHDRGGKFGWILEIPEMFPELSVDLSEVAFGFDNYRIVDEIQWSARLVPYLECYSFNDGEYPVLFLIYFDGKTLRGFIPVSGNIFNAEHGRAFHSDKSGNWLCDEDVLYVFRDVFPKLADGCTDAEIIEGSKGVDFDKIVRIKREWMEKDFCDAIEVKD